MARTRGKSQGRKANGTYVQLPHAIIQSPEYAELDAYAVKLLIDLFIQFRGDNNGDFTTAWSVMSERGWKSKDTFYRALSTLIERGWIIKTHGKGAGIYAACTLSHGFLLTSATGSWISHRPR